MDYPHLEGLQLADSLDDSYGTIDILIGTDHYWDVVTGETVRGDSGPTAVSSKFGWLLSGALRESVIACADSVSSNLIISGDCSFVPHPLPPTPHHEKQELVNTFEKFQKFWETDLGH